MDGTLLLVCFPHYSRGNYRLTQLKGGLFNLGSYKLSVRQGEFILIVYEFTALGSFGEPAFPPADNLRQLTYFMNNTNATDWAEYAESQLVLSSPDSSMHEKDLNDDGSKGYKCLGLLAFSRLQRAHGNQCFSSNLPPMTYP
jgi:hypothetical protein